MKLKRINVLRSDMRPWVSDYNKLFEHSNPKGESSRRKELQLQMYKAAMMQKVKKK
jgi:hypothetical protein